MTTTVDRRRRPLSNPPQTPTDVLQVITNTTRRGAEVFAVDLADELTSKGRPVRTVALSRGEEPGLEVAVLGRRPLGWRTLRSLRREARAAKLVVAHGSSAVAAAALATMGLRTPFVYRNIGDPTYWFTTAKRRLLMRWILRRAGAVVALWDGSAEELQRVAGRPLDIRVIPKGVPARRFPPVTASMRHAARRRFGVQGTVAIYIGSLTHEKNVEAVINAVGLVTEGTLLVVGTGPDREQLSQIADQEAPGRVVFAGALNNPAEALAAADVLVLPSHTEGIPGVLIEAAFCGLPVVASAVGGVSTVVDNGRSGILVDDPAPDVLARAIRSAVDSGQAMGQRGSDWCNARFEIGIVADRWDSFLAELGVW